MKRIIILSLLSFVFAITLCAQSMQDSARVAYDKGDYRATINIYEKEMKIQKEKGLESSDLYYNLGDAYFRAGDIAFARLYFERALLLDPSDRDVKHNIEYVMTKIEDKIPVSNTFFLNTWAVAVQNLFATNTWAVLAVVSFILLMLCLACFFFTRNTNVKKITFYIGIVLVINITLSNIFAFNQKSKVEYRNTAIIMVPSVSIVSSPDANSKEVFVLHAGTKVVITKEDRNWLEIEIDSGNVGWVQRNKIEKI